MQAGSGVAQFRLAGINPSCRARRQKTASMLPEALVVWPVKPLVEDTGGIFSPNTRRRAALSEASLLGVPVPCALT